MLRTRVICARPGSRIWECNIDGHVLKTHKFKYASNIDKINNTVLTSTSSSEHELNERLDNLQVLNKFFVIGYTSKAFYIFDFAFSKCFCSSSFGPIHTLKAINGDENDSVLLFTKDHRAFEIKFLNHSFHEKRPKLNFAYEIVNASKDMANDSKDEKKLYQERTILQNLFSIYKTFNHERYADVFDKYDFHGIRKLLYSLEKMLIQNGDDVEPLEAKKTCAYIYLDYINSESNNEIIQESENFLIDCLLLVNSRDNVGVHRCQFCNFPIIVMDDIIKYDETLKIIVIRLIARREKQRLFEIIELIPSALNILVNVMINEHNNKNAFDKKLNFEFETFMNMVFSSANEHFRRNNLQLCDVFYTCQFWLSFLSRLMRLHNEEVIQCTRCETISKLESETVYECYTFDYFFNECADIMKESAALDLCKFEAHRLPSDSISKTFYMKCLLGIS